MVILRIFRWFEARRVFNSNTRKGISRSAKRRAQLNLEQLEDRCVPATSTWNAAAAADWKLNGSWMGGAPQAGDTALFNALTSAPFLSQNQTVNTLESRGSGALGATYTTTLDLAGNTLTATNLTNVWSTAFAQGAAKAGVAGPSVLTLNSSAANGNLTTGELDVGLNGSIQSGAGLVPLNQQNQAYANINNNATVTVNGNGAVNVGGKTTGVLQVNQGTLNASTLSVGGVSGTNNYP